MMSATRIAITAMTTSSSIRVKPRVGEEGRTENLRIEMVKRLDSLSAGKRCNNKHLPNVVSVPGSA
jgi:hypothetical protein